MIIYLLYLIPIKSSPYYKKMKIIVNILIYIHKGTMVPFETVNNVTQPIPLPYPPSSPLLINEFTITPPGPFSLNDLLTEEIQDLYGVVYNGSFDTSYERYAIAIADFHIEQIVTAVYLNISATIAPLPELQYYSYPRSTAADANGMIDFYLSHKVPFFFSFLYFFTSPLSCFLFFCDC